jgi:hypothetical protein
VYVANDDGDGDDDNDNENDNDNDNDFVVVLVVVVVVVVDCRTSRILLSFRVIPPHISLHHHSHPSSSRSGRRSRPSTVQAHRNIICVVGLNFIKFIRFTIYLYKLWRGFISVLL